jgi:hypothetical protein
MKLAVGSARSDPGLLEDKMPSVGEHCLIFESCIPARGRPNADADSSATQHHGVPPIRYTRYDATLIGGTGHCRLVGEYGAKTSPASHA